MIKILLHTSGAKFIKNQAFINEDASPGTWGNLMLLKEEYKKLDESWGFAKSDFEQMLFNLRFLESMLEKHGELHCEYCGKENLKIIHWKAPRQNSIMATAYHSAKDNPSLRREVKNLRVACNKCNSKKGTHYWECKFPYLEHK